MDAREPAEVFGDAAELGDSFEAVLGVRLFVVDVEIVVVVELVVSRSVAEQSREEGSGAAARTLRTRRGKRRADSRRARR